MLAWLSPSFRSAHNCHVTGGDEEGVGLGQVSGDREVHYSCRLQATVKL